MEQLLNDYSRKGYLDGRGLRLPAIIVRDEPNTAASGYASALIREPLHGQDYCCPVGPETRIPVLSVGRCVALLVALAELPEGALGDYRNLNSPGPLPLGGRDRRGGGGLRRPRGWGRISFRPEHGRGADRGRLAEVHGGGAGREPRPRPRIPRSPPSCKTTGPRSPFE